MLVTQFAWCTNEHKPESLDVMVKQFTLTQPRLATVPGSSDPTGDEWPMYRGTLNHSALTNTTLLQWPQPIWIDRMNDSVQSSPAIVGGRVYCGSADNLLYCLNATTGTKLWNYTTGAGTTSSPAIADGRVVIGDYHQDVYCFNVTTGLKLWNYTMDNDVGSSPAIAKGRVIIATIYGKIYCLNVTTGSFLWSFSASDYVDSSPAIDGNRVYVSSWDHHIYCLNLVNGSKIWSYITGGRIVESSPAISSGRVYVGSEDYKIYCLNSSTGDYIWSYTTGGTVYGSPAVAYGRVYIGSQDWSFYCLNATTGTYIWSHSIVGIVIASPAVANGYVYEGCGLDLVCFNASMGAVIWSYNTNNWGVLDTSTAIAGGRVYQGGDYANKIFCFPMLITPSVPQNIQAISLNCGVRFTWNAPANFWGSKIIKYKIYRGSSLVNEALVATLDNVTTWSDTGLINGHSYFYRISAVSLAGEGALSEECSMIPGLPMEPRHLQVQARDGQVVLTWQVPESDCGASITNYRIYGGTIAGYETLLATTGDITSFTVTGLMNGQVYYFRVSAVNEFGEGSLSAEITATPTPSSTIVKVIITVVIIGIATMAGFVIFFFIARKKKAQAIETEINAVPPPRVTSKSIPVNASRRAWMTEKPYPEKIIFCKICCRSLCNYPNAVFCPYCGSKIQATPSRLFPVPRRTIRPLQEVPWLPPSAPLFVVNGVGIGLCALGGILSILLGLGLPRIYPDIFQFGFSVVGFILMATVIVGGIITLVGVAIVKSRPKIGKMVIIIGALVSGINLITIFGIARLSKAKK